MKYQVTHKTTYQYSAATPLSFNQVRLQPRSFDRQNCLHFSLTTNPSSTHRQDRTDFFGNALSFLSIQENHLKLQVISESLTEVQPFFIPEEYKNIPWETVKSDFEKSNSLEQAKIQQFIFDSPFVKRAPELTQYAMPSFPAGKPFFEGVQNLIERIYQDFSYIPNSTTTRTTLLEVIQSKKGVCQDFAHLGIGCLRSLGFPARYVSGYLETSPPPGKEKLVGSDASHAWISVPIPYFGWIDFDPTNNTVVSDRHITVAWGRDYGDVMPLNGIYWGKGTQVLNVAVDVARKDAEE